MSKIDLSKAKVGDKFINKDGNVFELIKIHSGCEYPYELTDELGCGYAVTNDGSYIIGEGHLLDLVKQVFYDEKDRVIVEMAKSEYEEAKEFGVVTQNLPHIVEQPKEDNPELQRRNEVVEEANELFIRGTMKDWYCETFEHGKTKKTYLEWIFGWAENFVYTREKYFKDGKL